MTNFKAKAKVFNALSNEVRLCILTNLYLDKQKKVGDLQKCTNVSQSFVSQQLSKLKEQGIIEYEKVGNEVFYFLVDDFVKNIIRDYVLKEC